MPVPQLPVELIKLIVDVPTLRKADLQSLNLTASVFPPLVRRHLFERLIIDLGWISEDNLPPIEAGERRAIALREMDRLMAFRRRHDLAALVKTVWLKGDYELKAPPWSTPMTAHDLMQLVYAIFPRLKEVASFYETPPIVPPRLSLQCCGTLRTIRSLNLDADTWNSLQTCSGLRHLGIYEMEFGGRVPTVPPSLPFHLETLNITIIWGSDTGDVFLTPFLLACGPTLKCLSLGINYEDVWDLSMLPKLASLTVEMRSGEPSKRLARLLSSGSRQSYRLATRSNTCRWTRRTRVPDLAEPLQGSSPRRKWQRYCPRP